MTRRPPCGRYPMFASWIMFSDIDGNLGLHATKPLKFYTRTVDA